MLKALVIAQAHGEEAAEEGGSFLVTPDVGLMIWTLLVFFISMYILRKLAFPRIAEALDRRRRAIDESIESAQRTKEEADQLLAEYRARLREAREQSEEIVARARKASDALQEQSKADASKQREELLAAARRDIEAETRRALQEIRKEVADLTVVATEKITRRSLDDADHRRLVEEALREVDFAELAGDGGTR